MNIEETMLEIAKLRGKTVEVSLTYHPYAKRWLAITKGIDNDDIEVKGKTAEIAVRCLLEQLEAQ